MKYQLNKTVNIMKTKKQNKELQLLKKRKAEANARRKVNEYWEKVEEGLNYKRAAVKQACKNATGTIRNECFDGMTLHLNPRSESKSYSSQKRILRRIVEKRQAQSIHHAIGRTINRFSNRMRACCISESVYQLQYGQLYA